MQFTIPQPRESLITFLRHAGYGLHRDPHATQPSFIRRLGAGEYPRFHLYYTETKARTVPALAGEEESSGSGGEVVFNLHLDQKQPSYKGSRTHAGEYEGETLAKEAARIKSMAVSLP